MDDSDETGITGGYLEVSYELLYDGLPRGETFDKDI